MNFSKECGATAKIGDRVDELMLTGAIIHLLQMDGDEDHFEERFHIVFEHGGGIFEWEASRKLGLENILSFSPTEISEKHCKLAKQIAESNAYEYRINYVRGIR